jgi:hypothetical protein
MKRPLRIEFDGQSWWHEWLLSADFVEEVGF